MTPSIPFTQPTRPEAASKPIDDDVKLEIHPDTLIGGRVIVDEYRKSTKMNVTLPTKSTKPRASSGSAAIPKKAAVAVGKSKAPEVAKKVIPENIRLLLCNGSSVLKGENVLIHGTFPEPLTRDNLKKLIPKHGGKCLESFNLTATLAVLGVKPGPDRLKKINDKGVVKTSPNGLVRMIEKRMRSDSEDENGDEDEAEENGDNHKLVDNEAVEEDEDHGNDDDGSEHNGTKGDHKGNEEVDEYEHNEANTHFGGNEEADEDSEHEKSSAKRQRV